MTSDETRRGGKWSNFPVKSNILSSLKRKHVICTAWVQSLNKRDDGREKHIDLAKNMSVLSLHDVLSTERHLLNVSFKTSLKSNLSTVVTTQNTAENKHLILHTLHTIALQVHLFLIGYCSQTKDSRLFPEPETAKVNFKLFSPYR